jgi:hypothetical protein
MTRLKLLRMQKGLTQRQAAAALGFSPSFLCRLECSWFTRCPNHAVVEQTLREFFGPDESFASLMQEVTPDLEPEYKVNHTQR